MASQENSILSNVHDALARLGQHQGDSYIGRGAKLRAIDKPANVPELIGAIDQGTSSTRFLVFENKTGTLIASSQMEIKRITPQEGWVEIDPSSIMLSVYATISNVYDQLIAHYNLPIGSNFETEFMPNLLSCIGICNQRESTVVWDSKTGQPLYNVIVWMDNRTKYIVDEMIDLIPGRDFNRFKDKTGLPMSTYFSAFKLKWLIENVDQVKDALREKRLLFGTVDTWILWNLTGGKHLTDVTNASRTFLMDIETLEWDKSLCKHFKVPMDILPQIKASADDFGSLSSGPFRETPITGVIGDQSAALFGHNCLQLGQTKATFGTGCFIMQNIGPGPYSGAISGVHREAKKGLVTTVGYKLRDRPACYALEGCIKIAGAALTWLRDNMQLIQNYEECETLVNKTTNSAGVFFVPALGGLYSPYWDPNAAGMFIGLSQFTRREHLVRATFDSIAFQTNDILSLMRGVANGLMIDGGLCKSDNLCQILADITGYDIIRPSMCETSALGAAMVAANGAGLWSYESMLDHSNEHLDTSSINFSNNHYPHECLHQESNYTPSKQPIGLHRVQSERFRARTKSSTSNEAAARHSRHVGKQSRAALTAANQQHHRKHLKSANGINDDAGGGKEGDRGGGGRLPLESVASKEGHQCHATRGLPNMDGANIPDGDCFCLSKPALENDVCTETDICSLESNHISQSNHPKGVAAVVAVNAEQVAPPSSGYNSSDNLEHTTSLSALSLRGRVDSPYSQITDAIMSSRANTPSCVDLNGRKASDDPASSAYHQEHSLTALSIRESSLPSDEDDERGDDDEDETENQSTVSSSYDPSLSRPKVYPYSMEKFLALKQKDLSKQVGLNPSSGGQKLVLENTQIGHKSANENGCNEMVHEFGGRDSYGEDGYDSSSPSSGSYVSDDDELAYRLEQPLSIIDASEKESVSCDPHEPSINRATLVSGQHKPDSQINKQMDVFQPYISLEHRTELVETWNRAVERSMQWTKVHHEEVKRIDYQRLSSMPISMYLFFSIGILALSSVLSFSNPLSSSFNPRI